MKYDSYHVMKKRKSYIVIFSLAISISILNIDAQTVTIMPLGNSITFDSHSGETRPDGDKISYRYKLYQLISSVGYDFDYVGSENSGNNYFQDPEMDDNAGFPGITDDQMAYLINTGYNQYAHIQEAPGPYLNYYSADIILLHIGTNGLTTDPGDVEDILDNIRFYDPDVYILVARIINRMTYHVETTIFNDNVEAMVNARGDNRIIMVNQETGAGIDYATDMYDNLHPNQSGYDKMAYKWFDAIMNLNQVPEITSIPVQHTDEGTSFEDINLDDNVVDVEDPDYLLQWTFQQQSSSNLNVSIDGSRILHVAPISSEWSGSENIWLKVTDTGNGAFKKADSIEVTFTVDAINDPPVIEGQNPISMNENTSYEITLSDLIYEDNDNTPPELSIEVQPGSNYSYTLQTITPTPGFYGELHVGIQLCDPFDCSNTFSLLITVINVNDPPEIESDPNINADDYEDYSYTIIASDPNAGDTVIYFADIIPIWTSFDGITHTLSGIPQWDNANNFYDVSLGVTDECDTVYQEFTIYVSNNDDPPEFTSDPDILAFIDSTYLYEITFFDIDEDDEPTLTVITKPDWLNYISETNTLIGVPSNGELNQEFPVVLELTDGKRTEYQTFTIVVQRASGIVSIPSGSQILNIYPNPSRDYINIELGSIKEKSQIELFDYQGKLMKKIQLNGGEKIIIIDVSEINPGLYFLSIILDNSIFTGKFIIE